MKDKLQIPIKAYIAVEKDPVCLLAPYLHTYLRLNLQKSRGVVRYNNPRNLLPGLRFLCDRVEDVTKELLQGVGMISSSRLWAVFTRTNSILSRRIRASGSSDWRLTLQWFVSYFHAELLISDSPLSDLSSLGNKQGLNYEKGQSKYFWDYVRYVHLIYCSSRQLLTVLPSIVKLLHKISPEHKLFFILENVASMKKQDREIITGDLTVLIQSSHRIYVL